MGKALGTHKVLPKLASTRIFAPSPPPQKKLRLPRASAFTQTELGEISLSKTEIISRMEQKKHSPSPKLGFYTNKKKTLNNMSLRSLLQVGGEGFEPTKPKQQIYSLSHLTTLETSRMRCKGRHCFRKSQEVDAFFLQESPPKGRKNLLHNTSQDNIFRVYSSGLYG